MKIFDTFEPCPQKINFVDKNNRVIGYDMEDRCCGDAGWFISDQKNYEVYDKKYNKIDYIVPSVKDYTFDPDYMEDVEGVGDFGANKIIFRLVNGDKELFLHLYNVHNGYYSHGFSIKQNDKTIKSGLI